MIARELIVAALVASHWVIEGDAGAARALGKDPVTVRAWMKRQGIQRPTVRVIAESHTPVAQLLRELAELRAKAHATTRIYMPGPARTAFLRELEGQQVAAQTKLRALLGYQAVVGGARAGVTSAAMRPAWEARW